MDNSDKEPILAARLEGGTATLDEALRLRALVANRGAPFPLNWEEKTLRLALAAEPGRSDLAQRLQVVIRQQIEPDAVLDGELDHQLESAKYHLKTALADMDPAFLPLYEGCKAMTMTSPERMFALFKAIEYVVRAGIEGDIVECGVWRGGSMMVAARALLINGCRDRDLYLFDTFEGLPRPDPERDIDVWGNPVIDGWLPHARSDESSSWAYASIEEVRANLGSTGYPEERVHLVKGMVERSIPEQAPRRIALLRLDTDWYVSTLHLLVSLYPRLMDNGVLIIDDYGHLQGARRAVDEFIAEQRLPLLLNRIDYTGRLAIKTAFPPSEPAVNPGATTVGAGGSDEEAVLARKLDDGTASLAEALRLNSLRTGRGAPFPLHWEERALRLALGAYPDRVDLADRLQQVLILQGDAKADPPDGAADVRWRDPEIVREARRHYADAASCDWPDQPPHGARWETYRQRMREAIATLDTPLAALHFAQTRIEFEHRKGITEEARFTARYEAELACEFPHFATLIDRFADMRQSAPGTTYWHKGRPISNILFYLARIVLTCLTHLPPPHTVLEIGGGYGAPARLWMTNPIEVPGHYIILDLPESLFFAELLIASEFADETILYVSSDTAIDPERLPRFILCPVQNVEKLQPVAIDLLINSGSFQEMTEDWVDFHMKWLDLLKIRFFYSLNYFGQPITYLAESSNLWSPRPSPAWIARHLRWNPAFVRMQGDRDYLEAVYEKIGPTDPPATETEIEIALRRFEERFISGESLVETMELVRRTGRVDVMLRVLERGLVRPGWHPKELLWIATALAARLPADSPVRSTVTEILRRLEAERCSGIEAIY